MTVTEDHQPGDPFDAVPASSAASAREAVNDMLGEYIQFHGDDRPFALAAGVMNRAGGVPCFLWRRGDPLGVRRTRV